MGLLYKPALLRGDKEDKRLPVCLSTDQAWIWSGCISSFRPLVGFLQPRQRELIPEGRDVKYSYVDKGRY